MKPKTKTDKVGGQILYYPFVKGPTKVIITHKNGKKETLKDSDYLIKDNKLTILK